MKSFQELQVAVTAIVTAAPSAVDQQVKDQIAALIAETPSGTDPVASVVLETLLLRMYASEPAANAVEAAVVSNVIADVLSADPGVVADHEKVTALIESSIALCEEFDPTVDLNPIALALCQIVQDVCATTDLPYPVVSEEVHAAISAALTARVKQPPAPEQTATATDASTAPVDAAATQADASTGTAQQTAPQADIAAAPVVDSGASADVAASATSAATDAIPVSAETSTSAPAADVPAEQPVASTETTATAETPVADAATQTTNVQETSNADSLQQPAGDIKETQAPATEQATAGATGTGQSATEEASPVVETAPVVQQSEPVAEVQGDVVQTEFGDLISSTLLTADVHVDDTTTFTVLEVLLRAFQISGGNVTLWNSLAQAKRDHMVDDALTIMKLEHQDKIVAAEAATKAADEAAAAPVEADPFADCTVIGKLSVNNIASYIENMNPRKPMGQEAGSRHQIAFYRTIVQIINSLDADFDKVFTHLLNTINEDKTDVFHERHIYRFFEAMPLPDNERVAYQRLLNLLMVAADPQSRPLVAKQINLDATLAGVITAAGRNNLVNYFKL